MTQERMVLAHLQEYGKITPLEAINYYGIMRLSAIIFNLRKAGHDITTNNKQALNRFNKITTFAEYKLEV